MIKRECIGKRHDGIRLYISYSDKGYFINKLTNKGEERYKYAIDVEMAACNYVETDILIEHTAMQVWQMETLGVDYWIPTMINVKVK